MLTVENESCISRQRMCLTTKAMRTREPHDMTQCTARRRGDDIPFLGLGTLGSGWQRQIDAGYSSSG